MGVLEGIFLFSISKSSISLSKSLINQSHTCILLGSLEILLRFKKDTTHQEFFLHKLPEINGFRHFSESNHFKETCVGLLSGLRSLNHKMLLLLTLLVQCGSITPMRLQISQNIKIQVSHLLERTSIPMFLP